MIEIKQCESTVYPELAGIWERSVRATHTFLNEEDIVEIRDALIPVYFPNTNLYRIIYDGTTAGFIGICGKNIAMLFIDDRFFGKGLGTQLIDFAKSLGAETVEVNEQNPGAQKFYEANGFHVIGRDEYDGDGRHFPILHMSL